jgi:competence protein ComEC
MGKAFALFLTLILYPHVLARDRFNEMVTWNVGQGQWVTRVTPTHCDHFDMGGEVAPLLEVAQLCGGAANRVFLSHWDLDHVGFVHKARRVLPQMCLAQKPKGHSNSLIKPNLLEDLESCDNQISSDIEIFSKAEAHPAINNASHVFVVKNWLIPGDSPQREEKLWLHEDVPLENVDHLVLGHHGSRTSTSTQLLRRLHHLQVAISSARFHKFGHPHLQTVRKLENMGLRPLKTEDFGHIHFREQAGPF